jgi:hypothetical protein
LKELTFGFRSRGAQKIEKEIAGGFKKWERLNRLRKKGERQANFRKPSLRG